MNAHPVQTLAPVYKFLDRMIAEHGHILYMALVYAVLPLIAWILSGGLRRKSSRREITATLLPIIVIRPPVLSPPLPPLIEDGPERGSRPLDNDDGSSSFAA
ncbi:MAG: hypothetical protein L0Y58_12335 [Verrucomicrobia subdivision 3 bacterium]|nr:hypothetical protein [Verrucomicrobiales bacterium]MCI0746185.1 hypothetical protein [Limisphaerales bacterium]